MKMEVVESKREGEDGEVSKNQREKGSKTKKTKAEKKRQNSRYITRSQTPDRCKKSKCSPTTTTTKSESTKYATFLGIFNSRKYQTTRNEPYPK